MQQAAIRCSLLPGVLQSLPAWPHGLQVQGCFKVKEAPASRRRPECISRSLKESLVLPLCHPWPHVHHNVLIGASKPCDPEPAQNLNSAILLSSLLISSLRDELEEQAKMFGGRRPRTHCMHGCNAVIYSPKLVRTIAVLVIIYTRPQINMEAHRGPYREDSSPTRGRKRQNVRSLCFCGPLLF